MKMTERLTPILEHLVFLALMLPTFVLVTAAAVSILQSDPSLPAPVQTALACELCQSHPADE
jgi:hypothetical protein